MTRTRILVAGAGVFGREHLARLAAMDAVELVGVADARSEAAAAAARQFSVPTSGTDTLSLIDRLRPDGVIVATSAASHLPLAGAALERGIPVLVEKPVATSLAEIRELRRIEAASKAFVQPGHVLRFYSGPRRLAEIVRSGAIGRILMISSRRLRDETHATRYSDIDPVLMTMVHDIDLALWLGGGIPLEARAFRAEGRNLHHSATGALVRDSLGIAWQLWTAWTFPEASVPADRVEVIGTEGGVELELGSFLRVYGTSPSFIDLTKEAADDDPLRRELECFVDAVRRGSASDIVTSADAENGLSAAEAILADLDRQKAAP